MVPITVSKWEHASPNFGCVLSSLGQVRNGEQKSYMLKNKELTGPTKGFIYLEIDVIYNAVSVVSCVCVSRLCDSDAEHNGKTTNIVILLRYIYQIA